MIEETDQQFQARLLAFFQSNPNASHGKVAREFRIRPSNASRFRKRFESRGLLPLKSLIQEAPIDHARIQS